MSNSKRRSLRLHERNRPEISESHDAREVLNFSSWTVVQLRKELKARGLHSSGLKADLVDRLVQSQQEPRMLHNSRAEGVDFDEPGPVLKERMKPVYETKCANGTTSQCVDEEEAKRQKKVDQQRRHAIVLWRKPIVTLTYFFLESLILLQDYKERVLKHKKTVTCLVLTTVLLLLVYNIDGNHQEVVSQVKSVLLWWAYWVGLGVLSSVGLGTGLHTFLLYLGPHIASVTLAAWECGTLDFPAPPYPDDIICPDDEHTSTVNLWTIMSKVRVEAFMWGAGTALGELPPYFMAKAARLSGGDIDDEELEEVEELERMTSAAGQNIWTRAKKFIHDFVERVGFFGILVCASVPNPLFDLAGITCGHCLVPFWTFFGATLIGKAVIKMHIQQTFVILSFSKQYVEAVLNFVGKIPTIGPYVQKPFKIAFEKQKEKLHRKAGGGTKISEPNILAWIFEKLVIAMIIYFVLSIVNSMAQAYAKRLDEKRRQTQKPSAAKAE